MTATLSKRIAQALFTLSFIFLAGIMIAGCAYVKDVVGDKGVDGARKAAGAAMTLYRESWQPLLAIYGTQPVCSATQKQPCQDAALYRKLYDLDGQVSTCTVAATIALNEANPDFSGIEDCVKSINNAELEFAKAGIVK